MLQVSEFNQGLPELPEGKLQCPSSLAQRSCRQLLLLLEYQIHQEKLLQFTLEEKQYKKGITQWTFMMKMLISTMQIVQI